MTTKQKILLATVAVIASGIYGYELSYRQTGIDFFESQTEITDEIVVESQVETSEDTQITSTNDAMEPVLEKSPTSEGESSGINPQEASEEATVSTSSSSLININTATLAELDTLPNIGEKRAQDIITYRTTNGAFQTIQDIMKVSGIADGIFADIKDLITV